MRRSLVVLVSALFIVGCAHSANGPDAAAPLAPTAVLGTSPAPDVLVPFHADVVWTKVEGTQVSLCTHPLPEGKVYLMRNTQTGTAVGTHLGSGEFLGHTCVYGTAEKGPEGWFGEVRFTAANGDVLVATSEFVSWTATSPERIALENVTFSKGGTGRFQVAEGTATCNVNATRRTATYDGSLRYGKKEK